MECQRYTSGMSEVNQWNVRGKTSGMPEVPVEYLRDTSGMSEVYQWNIRGIQVECQRYTSGISEV